MTQQHQTKGNFKGLLDFRVDAGDQVLQEHLEMCSKKHHTSPKQHKMSFQNASNSTVTDMSNKEQMGLILRYLKDSKPIERVVDYIMCKSITGAALCEDIQQSLRNLQLNLHNTVSQTYEGAANCSGHINSCAALFQKCVSHARYFHCSNHDLNLALCHSCKDVQEIRNMLGCAYGCFSFCFISFNLGILKNRIEYFSVETSFTSFQTWLPQV